jgi:hypothetical protein
VVSWWW